VVDKFPPSNPVLKLPSTNAIIYTMGVWGWQLSVQKQQANSPASSPFAKGETQRGLEINPKTQTQQNPPFANEWLKRKALKHITGRFSGRTAAKAADNNFYAP